jgi:hypothetical protein
MGQSDLELTVARQLEIDGQFVAHFDTDGAAGIAAVRAAGRRAGRLLGLNVRTVHSDPNKRDDNRVVVIVAVTGGMSGEDAARLTERGEMLISRMPAPPWELDQ